MSQPQLAVKPSASIRLQVNVIEFLSQPQPAVKPSVSIVLDIEIITLKSQPQPAVKPSVSKDGFTANFYMNWSQPQPAVKPSVRLAFFYPYISGSARAFFPGGGQDGSPNGRLSTPSRKMAKWRKIFPVFQEGYRC